MTLHLALNQAFFPSSTSRLVRLARGVCTCPFMYVLMYDVRLSEQVRVPLLMLVPSVTKCPLHIYSIVVCCRFACVWNIDSGAATPSLRDLYSVTESRQLIQSSCYLFLLRSHADNTHTHTHTQTGYIALTILYDHRFFDIFYLYL